MFPDDLKFIVGGSPTSGSADTTYAAVSMEGYAWIAAIAAFTSVHDSAVQTLHWQHRETTTDSWEDVAGTALSVGAEDEDEPHVNVLVRPTKRYVRAKIDKDATNSSTENVFYIAGGKRTSTPSSDESSYYLLTTSPVSGTP